MKYFRLLIVVGVALLLWSVAVGENKDLSMAGLENGRNHHPSRQ